MIKKQLYRMRWKGFQLKKRITDILCDEKGIGVVEVILILVEKPNAKHRYVLCGN